MLPYDPVRDASGSNRQPSTTKPAAKALIVSITYQGQQSVYSDERGKQCVWDMSLGGDHEAAQAMRDLLMGISHHDLERATHAEPCIR